MVCIGAAGNLWTRQDTDDDESNLTTLAVGRLSECNGRYTITAKYMPPKSVWYFSLPAHPQGEGTVKKKMPPWSE